MAQTFFPITPVDVNPDASGAYTEVDCSAYIPAGATGVILHVVETAGAESTMTIRKNGSTDNRLTDMLRDCHTWAMMGVDGSRIFEIYMENYADFDILLVGYTMAGVTFKTNAPSVSFDTSWQDIDFAAEAPGAIGIILEANPSGHTLFGVRKNGSTDDITGKQISHYGFSLVIGCDGDQIIEAKRDTGGVGWWLTGYITDGVIFATNSTEVTPSANGSWENFAALPDDAVMGIYQIVCPIYLNYGLQANGIGEEIYRDTGRHSWGIVAPAADKIVEGKKADANIKMFLIGYAYEEPSGVRNKSANMGAKMIAEKLI